MSRKTKNSVRIETPGPVDPTAAYLHPPSRTPHVLLMRVYQAPPCGCAVEGHGVIPSPIFIRFCPMHAAATDLLKALTLQLAAPFSVGQHDSGSGVTHRHDGDGAATGCRKCVADAAARAAIAEARRE